MKSITQVITSQSKLVAIFLLEIATKRVTHASSGKIGPFTTLGKPGARGFLGSSNTHPTFSQPELQCSCAPLC